MGDAAIQAVAGAGYHRIQVVRVQNKGVAHGEVVDISPIDANGVVDKTWRENPEPPSPHQTIRIVINM